ncbi:MAG: hypothetical protein IJ702_00990 [Fretibacterium sp.]|nr:hypothetical protein [Fretibacterium sp.]
MTRQLRRGLLCSLTRGGALPAWLARLNDLGSPFHAKLFCMGAAVLAPFRGRTVLNWAFDTASLGGAVSFACTCPAARKHAIRDGRRGVVVLGLPGFILSAALAFFLTVSIPAPGCSVARESCMALVLWSLPGGIFYFRRARHFWR